MLDSSFAEGVISAAKRNDPSPGKRESVSLGAGLLQQGDVFARTIVGIAGNIARAPVEDLARDLTECIPYRWTSAIGFGSSLDLISA